MEVCRVCILNWIRFGIGARECHMLVRVLTVIELCVCVCLEYAIMVSVGCSHCSEPCREAIFSATVAHDHCNTADDTSTRFNPT